MESQCCQTSKIVRSLDSLSHWKIQFETYNKNRTYLQIDVFQLTSLIHFINNHWKRKLYSQNIRTVAKGIEVSPNVPVYCKIRVVNIIKKT